MVIIESDEQTENVVERVIEDIWTLLLCLRRVSKQHMRMLVESSKKKHLSLSAQFQIITN